MMKKKYVLLIAMISTMLCGCSNLKDTNTTEYIELEPVSESSEIINNESAETVEQVAQEREEDASVTEFIPSQSTTVFEYDSVNNAITINGIVYTIATNEMDYSGGYMPYYMANSDMENIVECINSGDLSDTSWRDGCSDKLQEKINESDLLERFVSSGGKIIGYYIINGDFYHSTYEAEIPVVIHYSIGEETYYSIWVFYMQSFVEPEVGVLYQITDISQIDNLDEYIQNVYVSRFSSEDFYLLSSKEEFYERIACNPIIQQYEPNNAESTWESVEKSLEKCDVWNQQIELTGTGLKGLLGDSESGKIQNIVDLWKDYYQEKVSLFHTLYGMTGLIPGSMYTEIAADILVEDNTLMAYALLSLEYELSGDVHFVEVNAEDSVNAPSISWYDFDAESVCPEWSQDFQEILDSYSLDKKNSEELEVVITETANRIQETMGSEGDLVSNVNKYLSIINSLNELEEGVSTDDRYIKVKEERLRLYATQLLNIEYMLEEC